MHVLAHVCLLCSKLTSTGLSPTSPCVTIIPSKSLLLWCLPRKRVGSSWCSFLRFFFWPLLWLELREGSSLLWVSVGISFGILGVISWFYYFPRTHCHGDGGVLFTSVYQHDSPTTLGRQEEEFITKFLVQRDSREPQKVLWAWLVVIFKQWVSKQSWVLLDVTPKQ